MNKDKYISIRVTKAEKELIKKKAKDSGYTLSDYVFSCAMNHEITIVDLSILSEFTKRLKYVSNNLNQAMILAHQGKIKNIDISEVNKTIGDIWESLKMLQVKTKR